MRFLMIGSTIALAASAAFAGDIVVGSSTVNNVPLLPDNGCALDDNTGVGAGGITNDIAFTATGTIDDVNVRIEMTHTWRSDIQAALTYTGGGGTVRLANNVDGSGDNFFATFDSEAGLPCTDVANCGTTGNCGAAPGPVCQPLESLTAFDTLSAPGTFTLAVCDRATGDLGELVAWEITLEGAGLPVELMGFSVE